MINLAPTYRANAYSRVNHRWAHLRRFRALRLAPNLMGFAQEVKK